jgi:hypothetical protein
MLTFIPKEHKKIIQREYTIRFLTVVLFFLSAFALTITVLIFPYYFFIKTQKGASENLLVAATNASQSKESQKLRNQLNEIKLEANRIISTKALPVEEVMQTITALRGRGIVFGSVSYSLNTDNTVKLGLSGSASDREALRAFVKRLQEEKTFSGVDVPISNFTKDKDIGFSLVIKVSQGTQ